MFVGREGVAHNHHFLKAHNTKNFEFSVGGYELEIFGKVLGTEKAVLLHTINLSIESQEVEQFKKNDCIFFDWELATDSYQASATPPSPP